jgi:chemotaxis protein MotB
MYRIATSQNEKLRRFTIWSALRLTAVVGLLGLLSGCGYSEDEWQAQLGKYNALNGQYEQERAAHAETQAELAELQTRVSDLTKSLQDMGLKLEAEGTEKDKLQADLEQMQRALAEYKARAAQLERIKERFETLRSKLTKLTSLGLKVQIRHNRMVISLPGDVLFASGSDKLRDEGFKVLDAVADVIRSDKQLSKRYFQVAGHTDSAPLRGGRFNDNWGLSAMRARQVLVYLVSAQDAKGGGGGLDASRLHAAGYGETDPVADNSTPEGKQSNRRVELVLMPDVEEMLDLKSLL